MTGGVELIGDIGAEEQRQADMLQLKTAINSALKSTTNSLRQLPVGNFRGQIGTAITRTVNEIMKAPSSIPNLTRGLGRLRKLNRLIQINALDAPIGATGEKDQWKKLVYGKPDDPKRSEEVIVTPPKAGVQYVDINGVGNGMGDDYEDFGYYQEIAGLSDADGVGVEEPKYIQKRTVDAPSYEVPGRPGISPFETRIVEASGPGDVLRYKPESQIVNRDPTSSTWSKRAAPRQERGEAVDERSRAHRTKGDRGGYSAGASRQYEQILDGIDSSEQYVQARRGGGHTLIMDDLEDDLDFRYGSGLNGQSHLGDLGFSLPGGLPRLPKFGLKDKLKDVLPGGLPKLPKLPNPKEFLGNAFSKGLEVVKLIIEKMTDLRGNLFSLLSKAKDSAMEFTRKGVKSAVDRATKIGRFAAKGIRELDQKIKSAKRNALSFAKKYALKAYKAAKAQAKKAYSLSKKYTNKAYRVTKRNMGKLKKEVMKPLKSLNQRYENFKKLVTYGALALLGIIAVGGVILVL